MHNLVRAGEYKPNLKFWFEVGSDDEAEDRNQNGIIDAIDDVMDMMKELEAKGYKRETDFVYDEIAGGTHDIQTWEKALPAFFKWLFGK
jgi:enterochelin esterase-like enzyme